MKKYVRSFASMVVMSVFLILALSCECEFDPLTDCDDELPVNIKCEWYQTPITVHHKIHVKVIDAESKEPIENAGIHLYHFKRRLWTWDPANPEGCRMDDEKSEDFRNFNYLADGLYSHTLTVTYKSPLDKGQVSVNVSAEGYHTSLFNSIGDLNSNINGRSVTIKLLRVKLFP